MCRVLCGRGHQVTGIEFSEQMAQIASRTAPNARIIVDEFLGHDFKGEMFDGVYASAFVHLFPLDDARKVVQKIHGLLYPQGVALVSTTRHEVESEGFMIKAGFVSEQKRFRRLYDKPGIEELLTSGGFTIRNYGEVKDPTEPGKLWMNLVIQKVGQS